MLASGPIKDPSRLVVLPTLSLFAKFHNLPVLETSLFSPLRIKHGQERGLAVGRGYDALIFHSPYGPANGLSQVAALAPSGASGVMAAAQPA